MGARKRKYSPVLASLNYGVALLLYELLNVLPRWVAEELGTAVGLLVYRIDRRHRLLVQEQLHLAFPSWPIARIRRTARQCYVNFGQSAVEFARLGRSSRSEILNSVSVEGEDHLRAARDQGRGVIFLTAHLGNWELMAVVCTLLGYRLFPVVRPLDNPWLNRLIDRIRSRYGSAMISKKTETAGRDVIHALRRGDCVGILLDQNMASYDGVFVEFFGRPACTSNGLALIARRTGAPVIPAFIVREADGRHRIIIERPVELVKSRDIERDVLVNTGRCTSVIERMVRAYPEQWLWMHRRWKTQPAPQRPADTSGASPDGEQSPILQAGHHLS
jgi:KDO2-lipid IV(A) lauroyltransferase